MSIKFKKKHYIYIYIHQNKSQVEWIQDGFSLYNVSAARIPSEREQEQLLMLMGEEESDTKNHVPDYVKYNAFRWLRDSGFDPIDFALSYDKKDRSVNVINGMKMYLKMNESFSQKNNIGILPLIKKVEPNNIADEPRPAFFHTNVQLAGYSLMIVPVVIGCFMLLLFLLKKS